MPMNFNALILFASADQDCQSTTEQTTKFELNQSVPTVTPVIGNNTFLNPTNKIVMTTIDENSATALATIMATINTTSAPFTSNDGPAGLKETDSSGWETAVFGVTGVIVSVIVFSIIFVGVRFFRKTRKPGSFTVSNETNSISNANADQPPNQTIYDFADSTNGEISNNKVYLAPDENSDFYTVDDDSNQVYVAADENNIYAATDAAAKENNDISAPAGGQNNIYAAAEESSEICVAAEKNNPNKKTIVQAVTNNKQIKTNKPEMVDNILNHSYDG